MIKNTSGWWYNRAYVNEPNGITPEQYKMFFGLYEFGVSFKMANALLDCLNDENMNSILPCDELSPLAIGKIKDQIMSGQMSGTISYEGQTLDWKWDNLELTFDDEVGTDASFQDLPDYTKEKILSAMLDNECHMGEWYA